MGLHGIAKYVCMSDQYHIWLGWFCLGMGKRCSCKCFFGEAWESLYEASLGALMMVWIGAPQATMMGHTVKSPLGSNGPRSPLHLVVMSLICWGHTHFWKDAVQKEVPYTDSLNFFDLSVVPLLDAESFRRWVACSPLPLCKNCLGTWSVS